MKKKVRKLIKYFIEILLAACIIFISFLGISFMIKVANMENVKWFMKPLGASCGFLGMCGVLLDVIFMSNIGAGIADDYYWKKK